jgi:hypothetical protein
MFLQRRSGKVPEADVAEVMLAADMEALVEVSQKRLGTIGTFMHARHLRKSGLSRRGIVQASMPARGFLPVTENGCRSLPIKHQMAPNGYSNKIVARRMKKEVLRSC